MGGFSKVVPKDYPISPDIEDRRHEHKEGLPDRQFPVSAKDLQPIPEIVIRSKPGYSQAREQRRKVSE